MDSPADALGVTWGSVSCTLEEPEPAAPTNYNAHFDYNDVTPEYMLVSGLIQ